MDGRPNRRNKAAFSNPSTQCTAEVEEENILRYASDLGNRP